MRSVLHTLLWQLVDSGASWARPCHHRRFEPQPRAHVQQRLCHSVSSQTPTSSCTNFSLVSVLRKCCRHSSGWAYKLYGMIVSFVLSQGSGHKTQH